MEAITGNGAMGGITVRIADRNCILCSALIVTDIINTYSFDMWGPMKNHLLITPLFLLGLTFSVTPSAFADNQNYAPGYYMTPQTYYGQRSDYRSRDEHRYRDGEQHREDRRQEEHRRRYYHRGDH